MVKKMLVMGLMVLLNMSCGKENLKVDRKNEITEKYELKVDKGHIVINIGGKSAVIDTGSPLTAGSFDSKVWGNIRKGESVVAIPLSYIGKLAEVKMDALIGTDLLKKANFSISVRNKEMVVTTGKLSEEGTKVPLKFVMGVPELPVVINGMKTKALFDSGAFISYFPPETVKGLEPVGEKEDFYPILGKFTTKLYNVEVEIGKHKVILKGGVLPSILRLPLQLATFENVILGTELFDHFDIDFMMLEKDSYLKLRTLDSKEEKKEVE